MTNLEYRKSRGTHKKARINKKKVLAWWYKTNKEAIDAARRRKGRKRRWNAKDYEVDD